MDTRGFDHLTRTLTAQGTRRVALTGALVSALALLGMMETDARKKKKGKKKPKKITVPPVSPPPSPPASPPPASPPPPPATLACGAGGPCLVFLSSTIHTPNFGGLSGADAICQDLASAAGLPGTYKAWLSDGTSSVSSRFRPSSGPYRLVNGATIANNWDDLRDGSLLAGIKVTETGGDYGSQVSVWTGTTTTGSATAEHCKNWSTVASDSTGIYGLAYATDAQWTQFGPPLMCRPSSPLHFYCFQQS